MSSFTNVSRDDLVIALTVLRDERDKSTASSNVAKKVAAAIAGVPAGIITAATCPDVIPCVAGVAIATSIVSGSQQIAGDLFGGTSAGIYDGGVDAISNALMASSATAFTVSQATYNFVDNKGKIITSNTIFTISEEKRSFNFSAFDRNSFFVNPVTVLAKIFGF